MLGSMTNTTHGKLRSIIKGTANMLTYRAGDIQTEAYSYPKHFTARNFHATIATNATSSHVLASFARFAVQLESASLSLRPLRALR